MIPMNEPSFLAHDRNPEEDLAAGAEAEQPCLVLLAELEALLLLSQGALLSRDLAQIEQLTIGEVDLLRALTRFFPEGNPQPNQSRNHVCPALSDRVRVARARILHLGRVQAALLRRAQRSAAMIGNLLAGPGAAYGPNQDCDAAGLVRGR